MYEIMYAFILLNQSGQFYVCREYSMLGNTPLVNEWVKFH